MSAALAYRRDIQGLRALAVIAVMVFHLENAWLPGGFVGVDIFLVISGFLITSILLSHKSADDYRFTTALGKFYNSRLKRIVPAYFVMLIVVALIAGVLFIEDDFGTFKQGLKKALYFGSNGYFANFGDYFAPGSHEQPLLHTWSLAVEMQFYLLFPFLILLLPVKWLRWLLPLLLLGLLAISEYMLRVNGAQQVTYYALYARIPEFFIGAAIVLFGIGRGWTTRQSDVMWGLGLLLIVLSVVLPHDLFPGLWMLPPVLGAGLVIAAGNASLARYLCFPFLVWFGALSYSLYLWHWPVLAFVRYFTGEQQLNLWSALSFIALTLVLSAASYYGVEKRFHGRQPIIKGNKMVLALPVLLVLGIVSVKIGDIVNKWLSSPLPLAVEYRRYADPEAICHGKIVGDCLRGDLTSQREILVIGDSHAAMLNHYFDKLGQASGFKARVITASSCVTIPGFDFQRLPDWARKPCQDQIEQVGRYLDNASTIVIAGMWSYQTESEDFIKALKAFIEDRDRQAIPVYLMPQIVQLDKSPLRSLRFQNLGLPGQITHSPVSEQANARIADLAQSYAHARFMELDTQKLFTYAPFYGDELIYFDPDHLNEVGTALYAQVSHDSFTAAIGVAHQSWQ